MNKNNSTEFKIVIPARYASSRFPGKPLADIKGKPMIWHVYQRALESAATEIIVATDDQRIVDVCKSFNIDVCMTSEQCLSGTDRIAEVAENLQWSDSTVIVNVQGDEPLTPADVIRQVAANLMASEQAVMATLYAPISSYDDFHNPNIVKVVCDKNSHALYFSRAAIPWPRDHQQDLPAEMAYRHIGIYAYKTRFLKQYTELSETQLEDLEKLEQLRVLYHGFKIHVDEAKSVPPHGVDTPEQLQQLIDIM